MSWDIFVKNITGVYGPMDLVEREDGSLDFLFHVQEGEDGVIPLVEDVQEVASREGLKVHFLGSFEKSGRHFAYFRREQMSRKAELEDQGLPSDPMEYFSQYVTYTEGDDPETEPGIWIEESEGEYTIFLVEDLGRSEWAELRVTPAEGGWHIEYLYEEVLDERINLIPPDWDAGMVVPQAELSSWLEAKHTELSPEEEMLVEKESFVGVQFLPEGQSPQDYQRNLGEPMPRSEHSQNWNPDEEDDRYLKEKV